MTAPSLLHVGYMKSATTYLQGAVFNNEASGFCVPLNGRGRGLIVSEIIVSDSFTFDAQAVARRLDEAAAPVRERGMVPVWSEETLLGEPVSRRYDGHANALKLRAVLPQAKVLITIREQKAMAASLYGEYIRQHGMTTLSGFIGDGSEVPPYTPILRPDFMKFDRAVSAYRSLFGAENILVLPQELLAREPAQFFERLSIFLGRHIDMDAIGKNRIHGSLGATASRLRRVANRYLLTPHPIANITNRRFRFVEKSLKYFDRLPLGTLDKKIEDRTRRQIAKRYGTMFQDSNAALSDMIGLDLRQFGYD